jgi:hypothetical protein
MNESHVDHAAIRTFAEEKVNLPKASVDRYRDQVNKLRERLEKYIQETPGFALMKMMHAGSVAKGTALRTLNDMDVAVYVRKEEAPEAASLDDEELQPWLAERLREANPNLHPEQFARQSHCVTISFRGSGLDVDVVPVLWEGDEDNHGYLVDKETGNRILTSISRHLAFTRKRKREHQNHFAQVVRLAKWWKRHQKEQRQELRCKSFLLELVIAHLADSGAVLDDYPVALQGLFDYIVTTGLQERIAFTDYYPASELPGPTGAAIEIFDPVNPDNNVTGLYNETHRKLLVAAAEEAADAISEAHYATTKQRAVECWQRVLGPSFRG